MLLMADDRPWRIAKKQHMAPPSLQNGHIGFPKFNL
jgi:hypothetical protein